MGNKSAILMGIALVIALGTYLNWEYCCNPGSSGWDPDEVTVAPEPTNMFLLADPEGGFSFRHNDHFNFFFSKNRILPPLGRGVSEGVDSLKVYLDKHPGRILEITGLYRPGEKNTTDYRDLGEARASQVRNYMIGRGVKPRQISYFGRISDTIQVYDSIVKGPLVFVFSGVSPATVTDLNTTVESVQADPLVIRFEWGESEITLNAAEREKLGRIADFMARSETGICEVTGHTDNTSSAGFNKELGLKRANFVKDYLVTQGIPQDRIVTRSMGETDPIANNDSEGGRALNRRTVITIRN